MTAQAQDRPIQQRPYVVAIVPKEGALDRIKEFHGIDSDAALAKRIGVSGPMLSQVRNGTRGAGPRFLIGMLEEFGYGFHLGEDCIYDLMIDGTHCELEGP